MSFPATPNSAPHIAAQFIEPLIVTCKNLIERDQATFLALASPDITLKPFQHFLYSRRDESFYDSKISVYPFVVIQPGKTEAPNTEQLARYDETHTIIVEIAVIGSDPDNLTLQVMRYVKAVDWIWRSATKADLTWNLTTGHASTPLTDVTEHNYEPIRSLGPNSYFHTASLTLTAQFMEA